MGVTYMISNTSTLDARFGIGYNKGGKSPIGVGQPSLLTQAGITDRLPTDPTSSATREATHSSRTRLSTTRS